MKKNRATGGILGTSKPKERSAGGGEDTKGEMAMAGARKRRKGERLEPQACTLFLWGSPKPTSPTVDFMAEGGEGLS